MRKTYFTIFFLQNFLQDKTNLFQNFSFKMERDAKNFSNASLWSPYLFSNNLILLPVCNFTWTINKINSKPTNSAIEADSLPKNPALSPISQKFLF